MSDNQQKSTIGDPMWVESLMNPEEYSECHRLYPNTCLRSKQLPFDPIRHKLRWRYQMGSSSSKEERDTYNKGLEKLRIFLTEQLKNTNVLLP